MDPQTDRFPHAIRFCVSSRTHELLVELREDRCKNVSAWLRRAVDEALTREFGAEALKQPAADPDRSQTDASPLSVDDVDEPHVPALAPDELAARRKAPAVPGWRPDKLPDGDKWGARHDAPETLPADLVGRRLVVTDRRGRSWTSEALEVIERRPDTILVRDASRYMNRRRAAGG